MKDISKAKVIKKWKTRTIPIRKL